MRNRIGESYSKALKYGLLLGVLSPSALPAYAVSEKPTSSSVLSSNAPARESVVTPMTDRGTGVAPYSVRFRVTGFLARQHARDGNIRRSLIEFYSMLDVDDPAWTDDERGDSMRISRDIEVAQMMTAAGFFDHAIRILQTSFILASVNHDPQVAQVELQMRATAELAGLKHALVPEIDMSFLAEYESVRPTSSSDSVLTESTGRAPALQAESKDPVPPSSGREPDRLATSSHPVTAEATAQAPAVQAASKDVGPALSGREPVRPASSDRPVSTEATAPAESQDLGPALTDQEPVRAASSNRSNTTEPTVPTPAVPAAESRDPGPALTGLESVRVAAARPSDSSEPANAALPAHTDSRESGPALTGQPTVPTPQPVSPPNELPRIKPEPIPAREFPGKTAEKVEDGSRWSWLTPSRWRQKKEIAPAVDVQEEPSSPAPPTTSPNVAPTYCQECSGLHGRPPGNIVVRYNPRTGITHTHVSGSAAASPMPSPYQKKFVPLKADEHCARCANAPSSSAPADAAEMPTEQPVITPPASRSSGAPSSKSSGATDEVDVRLYDMPPYLPSNSARPARPVQQTADVTPSPARQDGPTPTSPPATERPEQVPVARPPSAGPSTVRPVAQVGLVGDVSNPGIFALQGRSTTLAALLRRTGEREIGSDKKARILRAVELRDGNPDETRRDVYCQRLEGSDARFGAMETPLYSQEVVIVDGSGERPIYVAVMPHFILQVPVDPNYPVTADQILEQLRAHWPEIRSQSIGILRYEQWGSATTGSRADEWHESPRSELFPGDVVYVDGTSLDRSQVISAAESIAKLAGARIRKHESPTK